MCDRFRLCRTFITSLGKYIPLELCPYDTPYWRYRLKEAVSDIWSRCTRSCPSYNRLGGEPTRCGTCENNGTISLKEPRVQLVVVPQRRSVIHSVPLGSHHLDEDVERSLVVVENEHVFAASNQLLHHEILTPSTQQEKVIFPPGRQDLPKCKYAYVSYLMNWFSVLTMVCRNFRYWTCFPCVSMQWTKCCTTFSLTYPKIIKNLSIENKCVLLINI